MKLVLFANWGLGSLVLEGLHGRPGIEVVGVVTQYDAGTTDSFVNVVHDTAVRLGLPVYHTLEGIPDALINGADLGLSVVFNRLFSADLLARLSILNVHPSLLPDYRSPSPSLWQIRDRANSMGLTIHHVDTGIDTGPVFRQTAFPADPETPYAQFIDEFNAAASAWIVEQVAGFRAEEPRTAPAERTDYYPRVRLPPTLHQRSLREVGDFLNRKRVCAFSGNRAEFGILYPLLRTLSETYYVDLVISGGHTQLPWNTRDEVYAMLARDALPVVVHEVDGRGVVDHYRDNFLLNYQFGYAFFKRFQNTWPVDLCLVLGDRVETYSFANAAFFNNVPVCHLFGGDIANVPYFDTNLRHAITKISCLHLASNRASLENLHRLGEEQWRCALMGNVSLDNYTTGAVAGKAELDQQYGLADEPTLVVTYHPSQFVDEQENLRVFLGVLEAVRGTGCQTIVTYPNNDDGHRLITEHLEGLPRRAGKLRVVPSMGMRGYLGVLAAFPCVTVGNSSSGLFETAFTGTPAINVGDRQVDRPRARNVIDVPLDRLCCLPAVLREVLDDYAAIRARNLEDREFFGSGHAVQVAMDHIAGFLTLDKQHRIFKKFV